MFEAYEEFTLTRQRYDDKLQEVFKERREIEGKLNILQAEYTQALTADIEGETPKTQAELTKITRKQDEIKRQLVDIENRIQAVETARNSRLKSMIPELERGCNDTVDEVFNNLKQHEDTLLKLKAEYLNYIVENLYTPINKAIEAQRATESAIKLVEPNYHKCLRNPFGSGFSLYDNYSRTDIAPREREIEIALKQGKLSDTIRLFNKTGETIANESNAMKRLREVLEEERKKRG